MINATSERSGSGINRGEGVHPLSQVRGPSMSAPALALALDPMGYNWLWHWLWLSGFSRVTQKSVYGSGVVTVVIVLGPAERL